MMFSSKSYICRSCLSQITTRQTPRSLSLSRRLYSTQPSTNPQQPPSAGFACLPSRRLISLTGPHAGHYLQGVITANISESTPPTSGFYAAFLNATGRVLNDVFIYPDPNWGGEGWLIEVDANEAEKLFKHIKRYKLRSKFDVRLVDQDELRVWSVWEDSTAQGEKWTAHTIGSRSQLKEGEIGCADKRAPGMGRRMILGGGRKPIVGESVEETTEEAYTVRRYLKGVAEGQSEIIGEAALPQESNIDYMGAIDYRKGCYVGQELTIRTHHTGVVRKRILPVMLYGEDEKTPEALEYIPAPGLELPPFGTSIGRVGKKGRSAGKWISGIGNIGLGLCRLEIMTDVIVQGESSGYKEGDEFKLEWEGTTTPNTVKVKAFVPSWHLNR